jgi:hypothetical protein
MTIQNRFRSKIGPLPLVAASLFWLVIIVAGLAVFMRYENRPGLAAEAPSDWPTATRIERATDRSTLIVLAHPHCPCTRATLNELARLTAKVGDKLAVIVVFIKPDGVQKGWERSDTWASAAEIPGVKVIVDEQGWESQFFDARTSGQSMLYDKNGKLLFSGGITIGRGSEGDNIGASAIVSLVNGEASRIHETSVFGCPLFAHDPYCHVKKEPLNAERIR